jgi:hypothetical protein
MFTEFVSSAEWSRVLNLCRRLVLNSTTQGNAFHPAMYVRRDYSRRQMAPTILDGLSAIRSNLIPDSNIIAVEPSLIDF